MPSQEKKRHLSVAVETKWLLSQFGKIEKDAIRSYVEEVEVGGLEDPHKHHSWRFDPY